MLHAAQEKQVRREPAEKAVRPIGSVWVAAKMQKAPEMT
jgi:hypothetical protein